MAEEAETRLAHENMVAAFSSLPPHTRLGTLEQVDGFVLAFTRSPVPMFNQVLPSGQGVTPQALTDAVRRARETGVGWVLQLRDGIDDALLPAVHQLGLVEDEESMPAMIRTDLQTVERPLLQGFEVRRAADAAGFDDHVATGSPTMRTWLGDGLINDPNVALFVGYADGAPVAKSMSVRSGDVIGIYNVGTVLSCRRRGYGWAMTAAAIRDGGASGCTTATLQASPMGLSVYAAHNFRTLFNYRAFGERPAACPS